MSGMQISYESMWNPSYVGLRGQAQADMNAAGGVEGVQGIDGKGKAGKVDATGKTECQTCKERKYQDGSDEMVSFKSAAHIAPEAAATRVRAHEQEHVSNAYTKAEQGNGKVLQASVAIHTSICPECGRSYVSGGPTTTRISYKEENPNGKNLKSYQAEATKGNNVDYAC